MIRFLILIFLGLSELQLACASVPLGVARKGTDGHYTLYGCLHTNDYYSANFAAYQVEGPLNPKKLPTPECVDLPKIGKTQISIDMLDQDIRKKRVGLKIVGAEKRIVTEVPLNLAKQGVIATEVNFPTPGHYRAIVTVEDIDLNMPLTATALEIPLTVALDIASPAATNTMRGMFMVLGLLILACAVLVPRLLKSSPTPGA